MSTFDRVCKIISEQTGMDKDKITMETNLKEDLGVDSLDNVEIIMAFEDEFEQNIPDGDFVKLQTVGDVVAYIDINANKVVLIKNE